MIIKENTDNKIEEMKAKLGLTGDVYLYNEHFIESLESHKNLIPNSTAQTIEEAYEERITWELEQSEKRRLEAEQYAHKHPEEFMEDKLRGE